MLFLSFQVNAEVLIADLLSESYSEKVKVSGMLISGIQISSVNPIKDLYVYLPKNSSLMLCSELTSIDGRYKGLVEKKLDSLLSGFVRVSFDSKYEGVLSSYNGKTLAAISYLGDECRGRGKRQYLVSSWSDQPHDSKVVVLLRSSARKDKVAVNNSDEYSKCKTIRDEYTVSFDKYCLISVGDIRWLTSLHLQRKNLQPIKDKYLKFAYTNEKS